MKIREINYKLAYGVGPLFTLTIILLAGVPYVIMHDCDIVAIAKIHLVSGLVAYIFGLIEKNTSEQVVDGGIMLIFLIFCLVAGVIGLAVMAIMKKSPVEMMKTQ